MGDVMEMDKRYDSRRIRRNRDEIFTLWMFVRIIQVNKGHKLNKLHPNTQGLIM